MLLREQSLKSSHHRADAIEQGTLKGKNNKQLTDDVLVGKCKECFSKYIQEKIKHLTFNATNTEQIPWQADPKTPL